MLLAFVGDDYRHDPSRGEAAETTGGAPGAQIFMARVVAGFGLPHTPVFPSQVLRKGPDCEEARFYAEIEHHLDAVRPDVILMFSNDHFNTFFFDNFPLFAIGVASETSGPNDETPMPTYSVPLHEGLADHLRAEGIRNDFDIAITQEFTLDHSFMVPWHFVNAKQRVPIVPFFIHCFSDPLPNAARAFALGRMLRAAIESYPGEARVAVIASGSFSLEIGGPLAPVGERSGTPDRMWAKAVEERLVEGEIDLLIEEATCERLQRAGNAAGELLNWIAMLGVIGADQTPISLHPQADHGHAFGIWRWD